MSTRMSDREGRLRMTRVSWDAATRAHNAHKRDQAAFLRGGGTTLFAEELQLLGDVDGQRVLHTMCNAGQDSVSLALRQRAIVTGVDFSDEAIGFARALARDTAARATFVASEIAAYLESTDDRFDVAFGTYGFLPWLDDVERFFRGVARVAARVAFVEFHPLAWSFDARFQLKDPYFAPGHVFTEPVSDYVGEAGPALAPSGFVETAPFVNPYAACSYQHTVADYVTAMINAGFVVDVLREWPYANGCRIHAGLVEATPARFTTPDGVPSIPLMLGAHARRR